MVTAFPICNRYNVADFKFRNPFKDSHETAPRYGTTREKICRTAGRLVEGGIKSPSITKLYLVGTIDRWNDAKKSEEHDRVKHDTKL